MNKLRILVADDEVLMCEELLAQFEQYQDIEVLAVCHDGDDALLKIKELKPDIVFLDIQMSGKTGLEVAANLTKQISPPIIVFLTAYADHAVKAFAVDAVDYVLKPFDDKDIQRVISKLRKIMAAKALEKNIGTSSRGDNNRKFCVHHSGRFEVIDNEQILYFYAKDRLVFIQTADDRHFSVKSSLNELEEKLDHKQFMRCHRNYIVNMEQIKHLENWFNRGYMLILKGDLKTEVPVSRLFVKRLKEFLEFE